jgi:hypothetical protein
VNVSVDLVLSPARALSAAEVAALATSITSLKVKQVALGPITANASGATVPMVSPLTDDARGVAQVMAIVHGRALATGLPVIRAVARQV